MKYKIGDTVKIIKENSVLNGRTGKIVEVFENLIGHSQYRIEGILEGDLRFSDKELKLIKSAEECKCEMVEIGSDLCQIKGDTLSLENLTWVKLYQCPKCKTVVIK